MMMNLLMNILQQSTPDTSQYMIAGYAVIFGVMGIYVASYFIRTKNLKQDLELLEDLDKTGEG